jgi:hypothetical protein
MKKKREYFPTYVENRCISLRTYIKNFYTSTVVKKFSSFRVEFVFLTQKPKGNRDVTFWGC